MADPTITVKLDTTEVVQTLSDFRTQMLAELGNEYVAGMEQAFDICIKTLSQSAKDPQMVNSHFGPGIAIAADVLKDLKAEAIKTFAKANRNALNNTAIETHTGETPNG